MKRLLFILAVMSSVNLQAQETSVNPVSDAEDEAATILNALADAYDTSTEDSIVNSFWRIIPTSGDSISPPYRFYGYQGYSAQGTFYRTLNLNAGDSINVTTPNTTGTYVVKVINLSTMLTVGSTTVIPSILNGGIHITVSSAGTYAVFAFSASRQMLHASITVNGSTYTNAAIAPNLLLFRQAPMEYSNFTKNATGPFLMMLISQQGGSRAVVDDVMDPSHFSWAANDVRLNFNSEDNTILGVVLVPKNTSYTGVSMDLFVRCQISPSIRTSYFPGMYKYDCLASAFGTSTYNSFAWACGRWLEWVDYVYSPGVTELAFYDALFASAGYTRTGATEANSCLDLYGLPTKPTYRNASIMHHSHRYALSYDWDLKLGTSIRLMHPRNALDTLTSSNSGFGHVMKYYRKIPNFVPTPIVYENISFTDEELAEIRSASRGISLQDSILFEKLYADVEEALDSSLCSTLLYLENVDVYKELLGRCLTYPSLMNMAYEKLDKGELIPCLLVYDVMQATDPSILERSKSQKAVSTDNSKIRIERNIQSEATACAKGLLKLARENTLKGFAVDNRTFSNDEEAFSVRIQGRDVHVSFCLGRESRVQLRVDTEQGMPIAQAYGRKLLGADKYDCNFHIPQGGAYIVSLLVNGQIYSRKIHVR